MSRFMVSAATLVLAAAMPLTANAFSFGFSEDDFSFGDSDYYGPRGGYGRYGPYAPPYPPRGYGRDSGPRAWGGGPGMQFGSNEGDQSAPAQGEQGREQQSRSSWKWGGSNWDDDSWGRRWQDRDGMNIDQGKTWRWGNSKMDWGNRWRPNFGSGYRPGYGPRWNMYPGWEQYQYGPQQRQQQRRQARDMPPRPAVAPEPQAPKQTETPAEQAPATQ